MRRSPEEWRAQEDRTLAALRRSPGERRFRALPWAAGLAAMLLIAALVVPWGRSGRFAPSVPAAVSARAQSLELSPEDRADDALLRDVASLSRGEEAADWNGLAPDPAAPDEEAL